MGLLTWSLGKKPEQAPLPDQGSDSTSSAPAGPGPAGSAAAAILEGRKERKDKGLPRGPRGTKLSPEQAQMAEAFAELYRPEIWQRVACAPADTMLALSGRKIWSLSDSERSDLGVTAAMTAKCFAVSDPKWLAIAILALTVADVYGSRATLHYLERKKEQEDAEAKALRDGKPA